MSILYYFKPPQFIPAVERIYEKALPLPQTKKIRKRRIKEDRTSLDVQVLEMREREAEDEIILSLMLEGIL